MPYLYKHVVLDTAAKIVAFADAHATSPRSQACTAHLQQVRSLSISLLHGGHNLLRTALPAVIGLCAEGMLGITAIQAPVDVLAEIVNRRTADELALITHVSILDELDASLSLSRALWERRNEAAGDVELLRGVARGLARVTHLHIGGRDPLLHLPRTLRTHGFACVRCIVYEEPTVWENQPRLFSRFNDVGDLPALFPALETMTARMPQESADRAFPTARGAVMERLAAWRNNQLRAHDVQFDLGTCCVKMSKRRNLPLPADAMAHSAVDAWKRHLMEIHTIAVPNRQSEDNIQLSSQCSRTWEPAQYEATHDRRSICALRSQDPAQLHIVFEAHLASGPTGDSPARSRGYALKIPFTSLGSLVAARKLLRWMELLRPASSTNW
ncbi:hypothetical protein AURDEDRAFT_163188 [Auricularia subglabra TFB-10046 SS5]|nr:hypothetical protein AURDEDRAFT_163188 [Auricularia subglabra TFB-10046 SS5]